MALLRKNIGLWARSLRFFSTEVQMKTQDPMKLMKSGGRAVPTMLVAKGNYLLNQWLLENQSLKHQDWVAARKELLLSTEFAITEATVDMIIVHLCLGTKNIDAAISYLQFLWNSNEHNMNLSCMISYLKLCYAKNSQPLSDLNKDYLVKMYDMIREKYPLLDSNSAEGCIMGITMTERWRESFEVLDMIKRMDTPRSAPYTAIIQAAFSNNVPELGWKYLDECLSKRNPSHSVYITYLDYCTRNFQGSELEEKIGQMFEFWCDQDVRPYVNVINAYEKALHALGWKTEHTSIREIGICRNCLHELKSLKVTNEQFAKLAKIIRERIIIGKDVYRKSTPEEFKYYLEFVEKTQPYDIVIDGLNVSYAMNQAKGRPDGFPLTEIFKMCEDKGNKILVLGRKHMLKWPKFDYNYMKQNGHVFLANNSSEDDPYILFATVRSGPQTKFVSNDLLRQYQFVMGNPELKKIFKYWQMAHRLAPSRINVGGRFKLVLKNPTMYVPLAQKDDGGFHVPYRTDPSLQPSLTYEPPKSWVCFRK